MKSYLTVRLEKRGRIRERFPRALKRAARMEFSAMNSECFPTGRKTLPFCYCL